MIKLRYSIKKYIIIFNQINILEEINTQFNSQFENYYNTYEKKRHQINEEIFENKKFVSEYYKIIRENSIRFKNNSGGESSKYKKANHLYKNLNLEDVKI